MIDAEYIFFAIQNIKHKYGFNYKNKPTNQNLEKIEILVPINDSGELDIVAQRVISSKNKLIQEIKEKLKNEIIKITSPDIEV